LPEASWSEKWEWVLDTGRGGFLEEEDPLKAGSMAWLESRALAILVKRKEE
jgi:hypothetical protein